MTRKFWINSFFIDYYDHWFDSRHDEGAQPWYRKVHGYSPSKREAFELMWDAGIATPAFQSAQMYAKLSGKDCEVVAYDDEYGHATSGKYRAMVSDVAAEHPDRLVSEFVYIEGPAKHTRVVHIGTSAIEFTMTSDHDWMSNTGTEIDMEYVWHGYSQKGPVPFGALPEHRHRHFGYPLYAIDYIECPRRGLLAVDFNLCPGLGKTPVSDIFPPKECADRILQWAQDYRFDTGERWEE